MKKYHNLFDLEISISSVHVLQMAGMWDLEDIMEMMDTHPARTTLALAKIKYDDFVVITEEIKKRTKNVLVKDDKTQ
jgi:hypothetical protein